MYSFIFKVFLIAIVKISIHTNWLTFRDIKYSNPTPCGFENDCTYKYFILYYITFAKLFSNISFNINVINSLYNKHLINNFNLLNEMKLIVFYFILQSALDFSFSAIVDDCPESEVEWTFDFV